MDVWHDGTAEGTDISESIGARRIRGANDTCPMASRNTSTRIFTVLWDSIRALRLLMSEPVTGGTAAHQKGRREGTATAVPYPYPLANSGRSAN
jgi:hypothetical protein